MDMKFFLFEKGFENCHEFWRGNLSPNIEEL